MATGALYSSSPPSAFTVQRIAAAAPSSRDIEIGRRPRQTQQPGSKPVKGGLSSLFANGAAKPADGLASLESCLASGSLGRQMDANVMSTARDIATSAHVKGDGWGSHTAAMNIPCSSSVRSRDRSPVSVLLGVSSGRSASSQSMPYTSSLARDANGSSSLGLTDAGEVQRPPFRSRRHSLSVLDGRRPVSRSVGFQLGTDHQAQAFARISKTMSAEHYQLSTGVGDMLVLSPLGGMGREQEAEFAFDLQADVAGFSWQDLESALDSPPPRPISPARMGGSVVPLESWEDLERNGKLRLAASMKQLSVRTEVEEDEEETVDADDLTLLASAQERHSMFRDSLVVESFYLAASAHRGQVRKDGQPYITHCIETALILAGSGLDNTIVAAGLLHDTLDDSAMTEVELREKVGKEVTDLVVQVGKLSMFSQMARDNKLDHSGAASDKLRDMYLVMVDVRVVLLKLADRLHNLRTLDALSAHKRLGIARETLDVFAPLANRLGIWSWKAEIEDLCFKYLFPQEHEELAQKLAESSSERIVMNAIQTLDGVLNAAGIPFYDLSGRPKNLYSIHQKMERKRRSIDGINDLRGIRLIVDSEADCYAALAEVQSLWEPVGPLKDYIKVPKENGYQSLHAVVRGADGYSVEIQIRTRKMHHEAEFGMAAHWRYKEGDGSQSTAALVKIIEFMRWMLTWQLELQDNKLRLGSSPPAAMDPLSGICPFPNHRPGCKYEDGRCSDAAAPAYADPVVVILLENKIMSVMELSGGSTAADAIREHGAGAAGGKGGRGAVLAQINHRTAPDLDLDQPLKTGDVLEFGPDPEAALSAPSVLPHFAPGGGWEGPPMDERAIELERRRLAKWLAAESALDGGHRPELPIGG